MRITVVGGGNVGTQIAVHCSEKKHEVIIYGSKPNKISKNLEIIDENGEITHRGSIKKATNNAKEAFSECDLIFITMPAFCMEELSKSILPYCYCGLKICIIPGTGGWECAFKKCIDKGAILIGMERVPSVARLETYGQRVCAKGYRNKLKIATLPQKNVQDGCELIRGLFDIECEEIPEYLCITMTPSNPILHTTRLYSLFKNYEEGIFYENIPLFYEEWDEETSELLLACDEEVQSICREIEKKTGLNLQNVRSLKEHYESYTKEDMTKKIRSIQSFKGLKTPNIKKEKGYIPDFGSRYFTADFPYGLSILIQLARMADVKVDNMEKVMNWYNKKNGNREQFIYANYSICNIEDLKKMYSI